MEDWDIPDQEDDFESRYADEMEMVNEMNDEHIDRPKTGFRKSLVFATPDKPAIEQSNKNGVSQAIKRQIDDMYALLSDGENDDEEMLDNNHNDHGASQDSQAKRARISASPDQENPRISQPETINQPSISPWRHNENTTSHDPPPPTTSTRPKVFTLPPLGKDCIALTGCDRGRRVYLYLNKEASMEPNKGNKRQLGNRRPTHLLGAPFSVLKEAIYEERRIKLLEESKRITESLNTVLHDELMNGDDDNGGGHHGEEPKQKGLWVDKYSPKTYIELLSDDGINRNLLCWLKLWDPVVFGKDKPKRKKSNEKQTQPKDKKWKKYNDEEDTEWMELDAAGRPLNKVALLCGPPGLGKTTLAHIVAQHAGYSVVEMNASDDRSVEVFRNKTESATQMQSVMDSGKRPNCLIIDEIDGAPTPAINVLLSLIKKKDSGTTDASNQAKKKKRKKAEMLSRPIICICNDPYVPALRLLRQQAFVLTFPPTMSGRLAQRLMEVSRNEVLETDMTTLLALCEKAENDIRSCLNTLQFLRQKKQNLTLDFIQSASIGQKDTQKSLFSLWKAIFQLPRQKKKRFAVLSRTLAQDTNTSLSLGDSTRQSEMTTSAARFYNILHLVSSNGQYNKLENGIFENYLNMKFKDAHLSLVVSATQWLEFTDLVSQSLLQQQNFVLMRYQPFLSVAFHMFFAGPSQPKISYPSTKYENTLKETKTLNIMSSMLNDVSPRLRGNLDNRTIAVELLPLLLHIITPSLRPVNAQLFSPSEKQQLLDLINTMISYNLTYHQERTIEGNYTYVLDPNIEDVVKFPGLPQHKQLTYATKQMIAREIGLEKMRRMERILQGRNVMKEETKKKQPSANKEHPSETHQTSPVVLHLKPKSLKPSTRKQEKDFFGRPIVPKTYDNLSQESNSKQKSKSPFWYKFQEGFSNAVRRTIKIQDLL